MSFALQARMLLLCVAPFCVPTKSNSRLSDGATEALKPDSSGDCPTGTCPIGRCPQGTNPVGPFFDPKKATAKKTVDAEIYSCEPPPGAGEICPVPPTCEEETDPTAPTAASTTHDFKLNLFDSWGDGWNGNAVTVDCDGSPVLEGATLSDGDSGDAGPFSCDEGSVMTGTWVTGSFTSEVSFEVVDETCGNGIVAGGDFGSSIDYTVSPCTSESKAMKHDISTRKRGKGGDHITCACVCPVGTCDNPADKDKPACADCASCYAGDTDPCAKST